MKDSSNSNTAMELREGLLFGMGNPLLDVSCPTDETLLKKYNLEPNAAILAGPTHEPLCDDLASLPGTEYFPGGACQNALCIAQWVLNKPKVSVFMGCIGRDEYGKILQKKAEECGVDTRYQYTDEKPTGTCAVVVTKNGTNRSLVANLAAANCFKKSHLDKPENRDLMEKAQFYYISGFFLTVSPDSMLDVARHASDMNKVFLLNLSAEFVPKFYKDTLQQLLPYIDFLFGNEAEAASLAANFGWPESDLKQLALRIASSQKANERRSRTVIFTQGPLPIIVATDGVVTEYPVVHLPPEKIVDTNGAGDAFVGGFLAQLIQGKPLADCIRCGIWTATEIIQRSGCTYPPVCSYNQNGN